MTGRIELKDSRERAVRSKSDYSGVVVWLKAAGAPSRPVKADRPAGHARMLQKGKTFDPHVLAVTVGTMVDFPNLDPIFHNAFSVYDGQLFDVGLYPPGTSQSIRFTRPGFVRVFCNIHSTMSAVIAVLDTGLFAVTQRDGRFAINEVPDGRYELHFYHERATSKTLESLSREIKVEGDSLELPPTEISESGYLAIPHKNKFGNEYAPPPDDADIYPATRK